MVLLECLTPILFCQLGETLDARWGHSSEGLPYFKVDEEPMPVANASLENLYEAYISRKKITDDDIVLDLWEKQTKSSKQSGQLPLGEPVSRDAWLSRIKEAERERFALAIEPDCRKLPSEEKTSLENLYMFCESMPAHPSQGTILAMWETFRKDRKRRREAARGDRLKSYSVEDWRSVFNQLDLHK